MKSSRLIIGLVIAAIALYFTFRDIDFGALRSALINAEWVWFVPAAGCFAAVLLVRAGRWAVILGGTRLSTTFHAMNIGYMMNMLLPGRLGEIGRAYVIGERTAVSMTRAVSSVVVERLLDLAAVVLMLAVVAQFLPMSPALVRPAAISGALVMVLIAAVGLLIWQADRFERVLRSILSRLPKLNAEQWVARFRDLCAGFRAIGQPRSLLAIFVLTLMLWAFSMLMAYLMMFAFVPARFDAASLMVIVANLGGAIPTPGGVGPAQYFAKLALTPFGIDEARGVAFVFVWWFAQLSLLVVLGFIGLLRVGMSLSQLRGQTQS